MKPQREEKYFDHVTAEGKEPLSSGSQSGGRSPGGPKDTERPSKK